MDFQDPQRMTALHYVLKKSSAKQQFPALVAFRPRVDLKSREGITPREIMERRGDPEVKEMATRLSARRQ